MAQHRTCDECGAKMARFWPRKRAEDGKMLCDACASEPRGGLVSKGNLDPFLGALRVEAHDSGDGQTVYHCPFCGSGAVIGSSNGSISCDYCHNNFTVQVQPQFPNMPQTDPLTGQPIVDPNMPGKIDKPIDLPPAQTGPRVGYPEMGADGPTVGGPVDGEDKSDGDKKTPEKKESAKIYRTAKGHLLDEEAFIRHMAMKFADDPEETALAIRAERRSY